VHGYKTQIQALDRSQPLLPMRPGTPERRPHDYKRCGTTDLFAALDFKTGTVLAQFHRRHRSQEFRQFLSAIDHEVPQDLDIHLILDNASTHKTPLVRNWLVRHPAITCISPQRVPLGSISSSAGSVSLPKSSFDAESIAAP
jgi:hypothetical protein